MTASNIHMHDEKRDVVLLYMGHASKTCKSQTTGGSKDTCPQPAVSCKNLQNIL